MHSLLLAITHLDPLEVVGTPEMGFLWISGILDSGYSEREQYSMAGGLVRLVEGFCGPQPYFNSIQSAWAPPLLNFLSLCEKFDFPESPPQPGLVALCILSDCPQVSNFDAAHIPTLTSLLSPNHRLQSRKLALTVFYKLTRECRSWMETVPGHHLDALLQAVGDPFHLPPESPHDQVRKVERRVWYEPMGAVVALIGFAPSELWHGHLHPSNFTSCEDILSTEKGRRSALHQMFMTALWHWPEFLCTPTKVVSAIGRLEALGCLNTAELVITWAWVSGMADAIDQDGGRLIEDETLRFYQAHGIRPLAALKRCIVQPFNKGYPDANQIDLFAAHYDGSPFRVGRSRRPSNLSQQTGGIPYQDEWKTDCVISRACQLRRLYHLFGCDPTTWEEVVGVEEAEEKREGLSGHSVMPGPFAGWECDYP